MKKAVVVSFTLLLVLIPKVNQSGNTPAGYRVKTVVIDAGHGGHDPGTLGATQTREKNIALAVALKVGQYIKENFADVKVIFTRSKDEFVELHERAEIANRNKADLFISIHCNSSPAPAAYGTEVYVLGLHKTEENLNVAKRENSVILMEDNYKQQYDGFDPNSPESHIIFSIYQDAYLQQSINLASKVDEQFKSRLNRSSRGVKQAGFLVLWKTTMPSMLIELGFISNKKEESYLNTQQGQSFMASAIFRAFKAYKLEMEPDAPHNVKDKGISEPVKGSKKTVKEPEPKMEPELEPVDKTAAPADDIKDDAAKNDAEKAITPQPEEIPVPKPKKVDTMAKAVTKLTAEKPPATEKPAKTAAKPQVKTAERPAEKPPVKKELKKSAAPDALVYKVQFMASKVKVTETKEPRLKKISDYEVEHTDYYRYMAGSFSTMAEAAALQAEIRKKGFPEAFVVAYKGGVKVALKQPPGAK